MNRLLAIALLVAAVATWTVETTNRERLTKRVDAMRHATRALSRVQAEHDALVRRQPFIGEVESLRRDRAELVSLRRELEHRAHAGSEREAALAALGREVLPMAVWLPTAEMKDLGRRTPHSTLQTFFWAAAAGNIPALKEVLSFEPGERQKVDEIAARPPEMLMAESLVKQAPAGEVRFLAEALKGFDEAAEYFAWRMPAGDTKVLCLRLRWGSGGWRVIVPGPALENAVRMLAGEPAVVAPDPFRGAARAPEPLP